MNKSQFIDLVQKSGNYKTKVEADAAIDAVTTAITNALASKEEVSLVGFGTFSTNLQKGKVGKVPGKPGQSYKTEDKMVPKFKPGKNLKDSVEAGK